MIVYIRFDVQQLISAARNEHGLKKEQSAQHAMLNAICYPFIYPWRTQQHRNVYIYIYIYIYIFIY